MKYVGAAAAPQQEREGPAARWWRPSTPAAASTPWLTGVVQHRRPLGPDPIGYVDAADRPGEVARPGRTTRRWHRRARRSRHLHRGPDPPGLPRRRHRGLADRGSDGPIVESDLVKALKDIAEVARRHRDGEPGGHPIDVLSLSLGYYHETPEDELFDPTMYDILREAGRVRRRGGLFGRQRRHRPADVPRSLVPMARRGRRSCTADPTSCPSSSVGALNPNGTDALFSNAGPWVRAYAYGASVMSTLPPLPGRAAAGRPHGARPARPRVDRPRRLHGRGSPCGAGRPSRPRSSPAGSPRQLRSARSTRDARRPEPTPWPARVGRGGRPDGHHAMMALVPAAAELQPARRRR